MLIQESGVSSATGTISPYLCYYIFNRTTDPDDMENKYNRVVAASLLAIRKLLTGLPANQVEPCNQALAGLLDNPRFWKHGKSKLTVVCGVTLIYHHLLEQFHTLQNPVKMYNNKKKSSR